MDLNEYISYLSSKGYIIYRCDDIDINIVRLRLEKDGYVISKVISMFEIGRTKLSEDYIIKTTLMDMVEEFEKKEWVKHE